MSILDSVDELPSEQVKTEALPAEENPKEHAQASSSSKGKEAKSEKHSRNVSKVSKKSSPYASLKENLIYYDLESPVKI